MMDIRCGDCLELMKEISDGSIDLVITDPPYLLSGTTGGGLYQQGTRHYHKEIASMANGFSKVVLDELCRVMKKINVYFFCSKNQILPLTDYFVKERKCNWNLITWSKTNPTPACGNKYLSDTEYILFFREKGVKIYGSYDTKKTYYVTKVNSDDKKKYGHPTIKPLHIVENLVLNSSLEGGMILDPFMGTGTTGVAAIKNQRDFMGFEIEEAYFSVAKDRIYSEVKDDE